MKKICNKNNKICAMCVHWEGYRLGYVNHDTGNFFKVDYSNKAKCMHPKDFAHFEKSPNQFCSKFENRYL